jgi:hypothetical protein
MSTPRPVSLNKAWAIELSEVEHFLTEYEAGPQLLPRYVAKAIELYRMFLALKSIHWEQRLVPSEPVDEVWHCHILMTQKYRDDCQFLFGMYLDHDPLYGTRSWEERIQYNKDTRTTYSLMQKHFNVSKKDYLLAGPEYEIVPYSE